MRRRRETRCAYLSFRFASIPIYIGHHFFFSLSLSSATRAYAWLALFFAIDAIILARVAAVFVALGRRWTIVSLLRWGEFRWRLRHAGMGESHNAEWIWMRACVISLKNSRKCRAAAVDARARDGRAFGNAKRECGTCIYIYVYASAVR